MEIVGAILLSYILGSIPFGYVIGRLKGVDLRAIGSGNIGTTNVYRALGLRYALCVFVLDSTKGLTATTLLSSLAREEAAYAPIICGLAVIAGSVASLFMRFRGGKGVATAVGVFIGLAPIATIVSIAVWAIVVGLTRYVSLGSITAAICLPILIHLLGSSYTVTQPTLYLSLCVAAIVIIRHRSNIGRLINGTEHKIGRLSKDG